MDSAVITSWVSDWGPLITLASTVVLAAITAWLAYLTKVMADSAKTAAQHSQVAAEASLASVAVAEASVDVRFDVQPDLTSTLGKMRDLLSELVADGMSGNDEVTDHLLRRITTWSGITLTCRGSTVTVHGLVLTHTSVQNDSESENADSRLRSIIQTEFEGEADGMDLSSDETLPRMCHAGESIHFEVKNRPVGETLVEFRVRVAYSFGAGPKRIRTSRWTESPPQPIGDNLTELKARKIST